jgi:hypothetical protein
VLCCRQHTKLCWTSSHHLKDWTGLSETKLYSTPSTACDRILNAARSDLFNESFEQCLSNSMEHSSHWEAYSSSPPEEIPFIFQHPKVHYHVHSIRHFTTSWARLIQLEFFYVISLRLALWRYISVRLLIILRDLCCFHHCICQYGLLLAFPT